MIFPKINGSLKKFWGKKMTKNIRVSLSNICLFLGRPKMFFLSVLIVFFSGGWELQWSLWWWCFRISPYTNIDGCFEKHLFDIKADYSFIYCVFAFLFFSNRRKIRFSFLSFLFFYASRRRIFYRFYILLHSFDFQN